MLNEFKEMLNEFNEMLCWQKHKCLHAECEYMARVNTIIFLIQCVSGSLLRVFVVHVHITMKIYLSGLSDRSKINPSGYPTHLYEQTVVKCGLGTAY